MSFNPFGTLSRRVVSVFKIVYMPNFVINFNRENNACVFFFGSVFCYEAYFLV